LQINKIIIKMDGHMGCDKINKTEVKLPATPVIRDNPFGRAQRNQLARRVIAVAANTLPSMPPDINGNALGPIKRTRIRSY
jgi:hypothetical protein